jgi:hypothetical protein
MTNKWTVNGVEAPEGSEFYAGGRFWKEGRGGCDVFYDYTYGWMVADIAYRASHLPDHQPRPTQLSRIEIIATNGNDGEHYNDYAFCLSEAIKKLKHCADVAPDDKRKDALLEIVDEVEFIKSEGIGDE